MTNIRCGLDRRMSITKEEICEKFDYWTGRAKCQTWGVWRVSCQTKGGSVGPGLIKFKLAKSLRNLIDYLHKAKCWKSGGCRVSCQAKGGSVCPAQAPSNQPIKFFALLWFITRLMLMIMGPFVTSWLDINSSHISGDFEQKDAQQCSCVVVWQL